MMRGIIRWSLAFRLLVISVAAALLLAGFTQLRGMPVDALPEFAPPYVEIQTEALGLSAPEVEQLITVPLEGDLLNGVAGIDVIRSESVMGLSSIVLVVEPGTDLADARQLVQERLTQAHALPAVSQPPAMLQPLSSTSRAMVIGLSSKHLSLVDLGLLARWTIRPRLLGVPGVASVAIWGQREHQLQVQVDPRRLRERDVSLAQVIKTAGNSQLVSPLSFLEASTPGSGGFIDTPNQRLQVRHVLPIAKPAGLAGVPVDGMNGNRSRLGDLTRVVEHHQPLIGDAVVDGGPGLLLVVEKFPGANTLAVTREIEEAVDALRPGLSGVTVDSSILRPANFVEAAMENVGLALLIGSVLLALVLAAFFFEWRTTLIALVSLPLSLAAAALALDLAGETMNALVLAGLLTAIGVVVDDAVIGVENVWRRLRQRPREGGEETVAAVVGAASLEMRRPVTYATLIVLLAALPVFFVGGRPGEFFEPVAASLSLAVLASMAVALTVTPALSLILLRDAPLDRRDAPLLRWLRRGYVDLLARVAGRPRPAFLAAGAVAVAALAALPQLGLSLLPSFEQRELLVHFDGAPGTSRPEMVRIAGRAGRELRSLPGVRNVGTHVGRAVMSDEVAGINSGQLWVSVDPAADYDRTVAAIEEVVHGYPGLETDVLTYSGQRIREVGALEHGKETAESGTPVGLDPLTGADEPVVVRVYGKELAPLRQKADEVRRAIAGVEGLVDPRVEPQPEEPTLEVEPDLAAVRRHGIKPGDVRRAAATLVQGLVVGSLFEEQKVFDVVVMGVSGVRHSVTSVRDLLVDTPSGERVRLGDVAKVRVAAAPTVIRREAASRRIDVEADVRGRDLDGVLADVERRVAGVEFPLEYHAEVVGESTEREAGAGRVLAFAVAAAIAIFLLLQAAFGSWRLATLLFLTLPLGLVGGVLAALASGGTVSLGSLVGFLAVFALAARNGILLVDRYRRLELDEGAPFGPGLVVRGAEERFAPILMTAVATALAVLPFLLLGDVAGHEIAHPMAVVVLGGLVTSTLVTLFVLPALCQRFMSNREPVEAAPE